MSRAIVGKLQEKWQHGLATLSNTLSPEKSFEGEGGTATAEEQKGSADAAGKVAPDTFRAVVYAGGHQNIKIDNITIKKFKGPNNEDLPHAVILKVVVSGICGSDLHHYNGRTAASKGLVLGHEITGEVVECGPAVQSLKPGDLVSVPFNISCGTCKHCKELNAHICLRANATIPGAAYGYAMMGGWQGGQAEYVQVPWAEFNCLKFPNKAQAMSKMLDLALLTDVLPTAHYAVENGEVTTGSTVLVVGCGPIGLAAILICLKLKGASHVVACDSKPDRLAIAQKMGAKTFQVGNGGSPADVTKRLRELIGEDFVDAAIECVGYEGHDYSDSSKNTPSSPLDMCVTGVRYGGVVSVAGVYLNADAGAPDSQTRNGIYPFNFGDAWMKCIKITTGQTPCIKHNRRLMNAVLQDRISFAEYVPVHVISLDEVPKAYEAFAKGEVGKWLVDPHNALGLRD